MRAFPKVFCLPVALGLVCGLQTGCSSDSSSDATVAVEVVSTVPASLALEHGVNDFVEVTFDQPVSIDSLRSGGLVVRSAGGTVPGRVDLDASGRTAIWQPQRLLVAGARHFIVINSIVEAATGLRAAPTEIEFRTRDERRWSAPSQIADRISGVEHLAPDSLGGMNLLTRFSVQAAVSHVFRATPAGLWSSPELVTDEGDAFGLEVAANGAVLGAMIVSSLGHVQQRLGPNVWSRPEPIPLQLRPSNLPASQLWPDPRLYRFVHGDANSNALRLGPLLATEPQPVGSGGIRAVCRVVTASESIDVPFAPGENLWAANRPIGVGRGTLLLGTAPDTSAASPQPQLVFVERVDGVGAAITRAGRDFLGMIPPGAVHLSSDLAVTARGNIVAGWILDRSVQPALPPFELEIYGSRFDPQTGVWGAGTLVATRTARSPILDLDVAIGNAGDAVVAWQTQLDLPPAIVGRRLEIAHAAAPGAGLMSGPTSGWSTRVVSENIADVNSSCAIAVDDGSQVFLTWIERSVGMSSLHSQRYRPGTGWGPVELVRVAAETALSDVHIVTSDEGHLTMVWLDEQRLMTRRFD